MKILFDHCVPRTLRRFFAGHTVETTAQNNWQELSNGRLLDAAQAGGFDVFLTVDQNLQYQQNLAGRSLRLLILVADNNLTATLAPLVPLALDALTTMQYGELRQVGPLAERAKRAKRLSEDVLEAIARNAIADALRAYGVSEDVLGNMVLEAGGTADERTFRATIPVNLTEAGSLLAIAMLNRYTGEVTIEIMKN